MEFQFQVIDGQTNNASCFVGRRGNEYIALTPSGVAVKILVNDFEKELDRWEKLGFYLAELTADQVQEFGLYPVS